jgi:hypothetical protein
MKSRGTVFLIFLIAAIPGPAIAQAKDADVNSYIAKAPIEGLPQGPYKRWNDDDKKKAYARVGGFCQFLCVDAYGNATFPNIAAAERARTEVRVCLGACIVNHLPPDYPDLPALTQELHANYDRAKQLGSSAPWPLPGK